MERSLKILLGITDWGFLLYWSITICMAAGLLSLPAEWLFKDYEDPNIIAWNWSFMPLDLLASITGLWAIRRANAGDPWQSLALISMILTFCAGFMALSFWVFQGSFDITWWLPNLFLMLWPVIMLKGLLNPLDQSKTNP